jgi:hypothetical protein
MKDAVMKSTISDMVLPRMAGAVESLDSLACGGLDQLKAAVPAIAEPTPQLVQSTKRAASGYWDSALQYLSSFTVSQVHGRMNYTDTKPYILAFLSVDVSFRLCDIVFNRFYRFHRLEIHSSRSWLLFSTQLVNCCPPWTKELYLCTVAPLPSL